MTSSKVITLTRTISISLFSLLVSVVAMADTGSEGDVQKLTHQINTIQHLLEGLGNHPSSRAHQHSLNQIDREIDLLISNANNLKRHLRDYSNGDADYSIRTNVGNTINHPTNKYSSQYTSAPLRGGKERATRVIRNPFPHRYVTGITFTGLDDEYVHVRDLFAYPYKRRLSHEGFSLSIHHSTQYIPVQGYLLNYLSIAAKRKNYFTATFHYD